MPTKPRRKTYRHGNVKAEAIKAASRLIAKAGHEALSVRQVADAVGVAHRSLYNHFADREALLDTVATEAFARLGDGLKAAKTKEDYTASFTD
jgi:AcrR family transcriptional regulator